MESRVRSLQASKATQNCLARRLGHATATARNSDCNSGVNVGSCCDGCLEGDCEEEDGRRAGVMAVRLLSSLRNARLEQRRSDAAAIAIAIAKKTKEKKKTSRNRWFRAFASARANHLACQPVQKHKEWADMLHSRRCGQQK